MYVVPPRVSERLMGDMNLKRKKRCGEIATGSVYEDFLALNVYEGTLDLPSNRIVTEGNERQLCKYCHGCIQIIN